MKIKPELIGNAMVEEKILEDRMEWSKIHEGPPRQRTGN